MSPLINLYQTCALEHLFLLNDVQGRSKKKQDDTVNGLSSMSGERADSKCNKGELEKINQG